MHRVLHKRLDQRLAEMEAQRQAVADDAERRAFSQALQLLSTEDLRNFVEDCDLVASGGDPATVDATRFCAFRSLPASTREMVAVIRRHVENETARHDA